MLGVLESGKINLRTDHGVAAVNVGECASCDIASGKVTVETVDLKYFTSWRYGTFYFYNTPLSEIVQKLGRWYDCISSLQMNPCGTCVSPGLLYEVNRLILC